MYNILVVDDEKTIRMNICQIVKNFMKDEVQVFEATDGLDALEVMKAVNIDIVITDIRMQPKDGLSMIEEMNRLGHDAVFIIISGFSEFEYARKAIEFNVIKYLLKPISRNELEQAITLSLDAVKSREERERLALESEKAFELKKDRTLQKIISSADMDAAQISRTLTELGISFPNSEYVVLLADLQRMNPYTAVDAVDFNRNLQGRVKSLLGKSNEHFISFFDSSSRLVIILNLMPGHYQESLCEKLKELVFLIESYCYPNHTTIGVSETAAGVENLHMLYSQADCALSYKLILPTNKLILFNYIKERKNNLTIPVNLFNSLMEAIQLNNKKQVNSSLDNIFSTDVLKLYSIDNIRMLYDNLLNYIFIHVINPNPDLRTDRKITQLFKMKLDDYNNINEVVLNIKKTAYVISDYLSTIMETDRESQIIHKAIDYIQKNYNCNISMSTVANYVGMSYNYFSKLFKDKVGENFIDYITRLRINKAKEMLADPEKDIRIISETVGYTSPRHFSKIFLQYTGLLPSQYRKQLGIL
ncbi:MAG TPA: response regulator [Clostridiaceae bacterium]|nr:response regulator [Clostridiaceae bacterium]